MMRAPYTLTRPQKLFVVGASIFITALVVAEATASKFFTAFQLPFTLTILGRDFDTVVMTAGVVSFPVTFIVTDLLNEYYGKAGIRLVTLIGMVMIIFQFALINITMALPTAAISPVSEAAFNQVFGATGRIIIGSLAAYLVGQIVDISLFHWLRRLSNGRHLWLRATGSTLGSQFLDTLVVLSVAFAGRLALQDILAITLFNYGYKLVIAIGITPLIYAAHWAMDRYLGHTTAEAMINAAEEGRPEQAFSS